MKTHTPRRSKPPLYMVVLAGWLPCLLACIVGALTVMLDKPSLMWFDALLFAFYSVAALFLTPLLQAMWARGATLLSMTGALAVATFALALGATALMYKAALFTHVVSGQFGWETVVLRSQTIWILLIAYCAIYISAGYYRVTIEERHRALQATAAAKEATLLALRYQLHPHFLFNTLNAISSLIMDDRPQDATRTIARLADFLRATLSVKGGHEVSVAEELSLAEYYLDIEKMRLGPRLEVSCSVDAEAMSAAIPYLLLQPLIENAVRHGVANRPGKGRISLQLHVQGDRLKLFLENDGAVQDAEKATGGDRMTVGLRNVEERLRHLYGEDQSLTLNVSGDGRAQVSIDMPYRRFEHHDHANA
ncbi:sensor histidine kinase [Dyella flava]|uniref:Histidine kinase n=1 Tax=Dyella flava TaxID=1920170 RepID=A0ABS2JZC9_9GAMM|nr:histidine kinase [Dyella flava]MBM7124224.1 histidine kinase [Dyella flava]GLQ50499.1 hypothetical protein GCM10010872_19480 [Dyella flava]